MCVTLCVDVCVDVCVGVFKCMSLSVGVYRAYTVHNYVCSFLVSKCNDRPMSLF